MKDFTYQAHKALLSNLLKNSYNFNTFSEYLGNTPQKPRFSKYIILRHDVEQHYSNALKFAQIQHDIGIKGTYYFRILPQCFKPEIVKQIANLGHEVGYHYDDLTYCKGDHDKAIKRFEKNLNILRELAEVKTICMDGSPLSKYDNKDLWGNSKRQTPNVKRQTPNVKHQTSNTKYYQDYNILGDPYFDIDFNEVFYLTDTGRCWDGWKVSVRDKVPQQEQWIKQGLTFHSTDDIIRSANAGRLPDKIMFTFHPQRWNDKPLPWVKELVWQNVKNQVKKLMVKDKRE